MSLEHIQELLLISGSLSRAATLTLSLTRLTTSLVRVQLTSMILERAMCGLSVERRMAHSKLSSAIVSLLDGKAQP